ncbi:MAG: hypothetical protein WCG21_03390 [Eubacteriales bacterium]
MNLIIWGLVCIFLDVNLPVGPVTIDIIPDFLGFILIAAGMQAYVSQSENYRKVRPFVWGAAVISAAVYIANMFGVIPLNTLTSVIITVILMVLYLIATYYIYRGIRELEQKQGRVLGAENLKVIWIVMAAAEGLTLVCYYLPVLILLQMIVSFAANVAFLVQIIRIKKILEPQAGVPASKTED